MAANIDCMQTCEYLLVEIVEILGLMIEMLIASEGEAKA